jgi:membrane protein YqaA with SNARE-associated domain
VLRRLYDWTLAKAAGPGAERWLAGISFADSSFFPVPPDVMQIPMSIARPEKSFRYAAVSTVASVAGALLGYLGVRGAGSGRAPDARGARTVRARSG